MDEKYRIISFVHEVFVDEWDFDFRFPEKSTTHRNTDTFLFWFFLDLLGNQEKCNIRDLGTGNLEGLEKSCTLLISNDDKVSFLKQFPERHFVFYLLYFE